MTLVALLAGLALFGSVQGQGVIREDPAEVAAEPERRPDHEPAAAALSDTGSLVASPRANADGAPPAASAGILGELLKDLDEVDAMSSPDLEKLAKETEGHRRYFAQEKLTSGRVLSANLVDEWLDEMSPEEISQWRKALDNQILHGDANDEARVEARRQIMDRHCDEAVRRRIEDDLPDPTVAKAIGQIAQVMGMTLPVLEQAKLQAKDDHEKLIVQRAIEAKQRTPAGGIKFKKEDLGVLLNSMDLEELRAVLKMNDAQRAEVQEMFETQEVFDEYEQRAKDMYAAGPQAAKRNKKKTGLNGGQIAGIVIGVLGAVLLIAGGSYYIYQKRKSEEYM